jgi:hypothetical protein
MKLALALLGLVFALPAAARPAQTGGYAIELVDVGGTPLPTYQHRGDVYVLGSYGQRYNVRVVNRTGERVEAVITVDGRDAISGENGSFRQRGYVLDPYGSVTVEGFRQNLSEVAAFRFTSPGDSYAGRRGSVRNNGVVGVALFRERAPAWQRRPQPIAHDRFGKAETRGPNKAPRVDAPMDLDDGLVGGGLGDVAAAEAPASADMARKSRGEGGGGRRAPARQNLGTQYGESVYSNVVEVPFHRRSDRPDTVLSLYYDDADGLRTKGVITDPDWYSGSPDPFPAHRRFAPPPR